MKRTYNINISGEPFVIDDDAYVLLNEYLDTLKHAFANTADSRLLLDDIEMRISELFGERIEAGSKVITIADVQEVISRIGQPEDFIEETDRISVDKDGNVKEEIKEERKAVPPPVPPAFGEPRKRFFRDTQDKVLGGVCSGLAHYIGIDPVWIRIIMVLFFFFSSSTFFIIYVLLWIIIPAADTPIKRLQMYGQAPTLQNIGREVSAEGQESQSTASEVFGVLAKVFMACIGFVAIVIAGAMAVAFVTLVIALVCFPFGIDVTMIPEGVLSEAPVWLVLLTGIATTLLIGIPCMAIVWCALSMFSKKINISTKWIVTMAVVWGVSLIMTIAGGLVIGQDFRDRDWNETIHEGIEVRMNEIERHADSIELMADSIEARADSIEARAEILQEKADKLRDRDF